MRGWNVPQAEHDLRRHQAMQLGAGRDLPVTQVRFVPSRSPTRQTLGCGSPCCRTRAAGSNPPRTKTRAQLASLYRLFCIVRVRRAARRQSTAGNDELLTRGIVGHHGNLLEATGCTLGWPAQQRLQRHAAFERGCRDRDWRNEAGWQCYRWTACGGNVLGDRPRGSGFGRWQRRYGGWFDRNHTECSPHSADRV